MLKAFREGANDVYLHPLRAGVQVIAGTVLGHVARPRARAAAARGPTSSSRSARPALGAPLIDPKPILDGWVALENTSIFRAKGENPFLATSPTIGQVLLESKQQLEPQVLHDGGIRLGRCGRQDVQAGRVDKRVLAMLEYLSVSGLRPTVGGLRCAQPARRGWPPTRQRRRASRLDITAVNGVAGRRPPGPGLDRRHDRAQAADAAGPVQAAADRQPAELPRRDGRAREPARARRDPGRASRPRARRGRAARRQLGALAEPVDQADRAPRRDPRPDRRARAVDGRAPGRSRREEGGRHGGNH